MANRVTAPPCWRPTRWRWVFWAAIHGLVVLDLAGRLPTEPSFETLRVTALGALMRGLRPWSGGGASP